MQHVHSRSKTAVVEVRLWWQVDALLSRVKVLKERIEATESLITLDLDHRRNNIVEFNLVDTSLSTCGLLLPWSCKFGVH